MVVLEDVTAYKKKKKQVSRSDRRSDHKHNYEKIILNFCGYCWAKRCSVCGRIDTSHSYTERYKDFTKKVNYPGFCYDDFLEPTEIHAKFPDIPIYTRINKKDYSYDSYNVELMHFD